MTSSADKADNAERAERLVADGAARGAKIVVLPERWTGIGGAELLWKAAEPLANGETVLAMAGWARTHGIWLIGGSITELVDGGTRLANTCVVFSPEGEVVATYRKLHAFDVDVGDRSYRESETDEPGNEIVGCELGGWRTGLSICYDLRFPELYRIHALRGCELVAIPSAFTLHTGKDHWELLVRARAVENQYFVIAAAQWGRRPDGAETFGRSLIVDPWGIVLAQAPDADCVITADLDIAVLRRVRASIPALRNRRSDVYDFSDMVSEPATDRPHRSEVKVELTDANV